MKTYEPVCIKYSAIQYTRDNEDGVVRCIKENMERYNIEDIFPSKSVYCISIRGDADFQYIHVNDWILFSHDMKLFKIIRPEVFDEEFKECL